MKPKKTSPLDISILIHYYCTPRDIANVEAPGVQESIQNFLELGLIENSTEEGVKYKANRDAVGVYLEELSKVPYPVNKWVVEKK